MKSKTPGIDAAVGVEYSIEIVRNGTVIDTFKFHNLVPEEGLNHIVNVVLKGAAQTSQWFLGLFEGNYNPHTTDRAATIPQAATECVNYLPTDRPQLLTGETVGGVADNSASRAEFTFASARTVYGAFITPSRVKGSATGPLLSIARFPTPKNVEADDSLRVSASFTARSI